MNYEGHTPGPWKVDPQFPGMVRINDDPISAYNIVREYVDKRDLGFTGERVLESIELLAEEGDYPECHTQLFIHKEDTTP